MGAGIITIITIIIVPFLELGFANTKSVPLLHSTSNAVDGVQVAPEEAREGQTV